MFLTFIALVFILFITFFIGNHVGKSVPDEIVGAKKYLLLAQDFLLIVIIGLALLGFGRPYVAVLVVTVMVVARAFVSMDMTHAPLSGIVLGSLMFEPIEFQITLVLLLMVLNFFVGAMLKRPMRKAIMQPIGAILMYGLIVLI